MPFGRTRSRQPERALRIFFATDVHGSERCFRKFLAAAKVYEADVLLLGGDVAGKGLVPVVRDNGTVSAEVHGERVTVPVGDIAQLEADINRMGFYPVQMSLEDVASLREDPAALDRLFRREIVAQITRWCELADERLAPEVRCIITPGNDDPTEIDAVLRSARRVECPEGELCELGPALLASMGDVTPNAVEHGARVQRGGTGRADRGDDGCGAGWARERRQLPLSPVRIRARRGA